MVLVITSVHENTSVNPFKTIDSLFTFVRPDDVFQRLR